MKISVFGLGYVGAVSCGCLAALGHEVIGVDVEPSKVDRIQRGQSPIIEEGLGEILHDAKSKGRLTATTDGVHAVKATEMGLLCVGTPSTPSGGVNDKYLRRVCEQIGDAVRKHQPPFFAVLNRSTTLAPIHQRLQNILVNHSGRDLGDGIGYCCHPEFLREGVAVEDFYNPPKIVYGATDKKTEAMCRQLYPGIEAETFFVSPEVASMVKYADNCFHALKVTFGNEIGMLCKAMNINSHEVMRIFCRDRKLNISDKYLRPGLAFGGSCLPKDIRGILDGARETATQLPMLAGTFESNRVQIDAMLQRIIAADRPSVGIVGLAFKEGTDDVRESPMVTLVEQLTGKGHPVRIFDEHLGLQNLIGANLSYALASIPHLGELLTNDLQQVVDSAKVVVISHRLSPERWNSIRWKHVQRVIDLVNIPELRAAPGYEGLYW